MDFQCSQCYASFSSQYDLGEHVKASHPDYYHDTFILLPIVVDDLATVGTTTTVITTPPTVVPTEVEAETDECCGCCGDDGDGELCGCDCDGCCDCGDCCGCGDCIGCGDAPDCGDCCTCSVM